ncbi:ribonucleoside hydrolase RihC [Furfurilactobacillus rossiae]|nr:ribonucleoside hydrolase RihC [Furfurilactobacillus rossiae]QFR67522.1 ribonucleoside hydrolase RihC [Furfurilactobacillus rossiae]QLE60474.1 Inosine-uridine preferring nucleoside hydrolase [Furfurilactobacillus rossiae]
MTYKVIMDTDPGIDDAAALSMALNDPQIDLQLITAVAGNVTVDKTTKNALTIDNFYGKHVPVAGGAKTPLIKEFEDAARIHGASGMAGYDFPEPTDKAIDKSAVEALHDAIMASDEKIILVPTGSYTNTALLFIQYPEVKDHIEKIIAMGGSLGHGNMTSAAEFNVFTDPHAAKIMYDSGVPIVMVGLDVTMKALITDETLETIDKFGRAGHMLHEIISHDFDHNENGTAVHDANTIFYLLHPEAYTTKDYWVDVVTDGPANGETVADVRGAYHDGKTNASVCVDVDAAAFNKWFIDEVKNFKN